MEAHWECEPRQVGQDQKRLLFLINPPATRVIAKSQAETSDNRDGTDNFFCISFR